MTETLTPLVPGSLLRSARAELDRQILEQVPVGKRGAVMTIVDAEGARLGVAATYKGVVTVTLEVSQKWAKIAPTASLKLKAVF